MLSGCVQLPPLHMSSVHSSLSLAHGALLFGLEHVPSSPHTSSVQMFSSSHCELNEHSVAAQVNVPAMQLFSPSQSGLGFPGLPPVFLKQRSGLHLTNGLFPQSASTSQLSEFNGSVTSAQSQSVAHCSQLLSMHFGVASLVHGPDPSGGPGQSSPKSQSHGSLQMPSTHVLQNCGAKPDGDTHGNGQSISVVQGIGSQHPFVHCWSGAHHVLSSHGSAHSCAVTVRT